MIKRIGFFTILLMFFSAQAHAASFVTVESDGVEDTIILATGTVPNYKVFFLDNPARLVVDVPLKAVPPAALSNHYKGELIDKIRAGRFDGSTIRVVFDLSRKCKLVEKSFANGTLTLRIAPDGKATEQKSAKAKPPQKPLIIIDAGHGGDDPGTIGSHGTQEKDVVLTFAKALEDNLLRSGKYRVQLTRESDMFIPLRGRVKIARAAKGSIFISLHADSAPGEDARGLSVYTLSEKSSDAETEALAAHENKADILGGMDLSNEREDVADILISLAQRETRNQSATLADMLVQSLGKNVRLLPNTHRFAGFAVLKAPDIPSVLIETGFLSHPGEEKLLKTSEYRKKLINGIATGIDRYFAKTSSN